MIYVVVHMNLRGFKRKKLLISFSNNNQTMYPSLFVYNYVKKFFVVTIYFMTNKIINVAHVNFT